MSTRAGQLSSRFFSKLRGLTNVGVLMQKCIFSALPRYLLDQNERWHGHLRINCLEAVIENDFNQDVNTLQIGSFLLSTEVLAPSLKIRPHFFECSTFWYEFGKAIKKWPADNGLIALRLWSGHWSDWLIDWLRILFPLKFKGQNMRFDMLAGAAWC